MEEKNIRILEMNGDQSIDIGKRFKDKDRTFCPPGSSGRSEEILLVGYTDVLE